MKPKKNIKKKVNRSATAEKGWDSVKENDATQVKVEDDWTKDLDWSKAEAKDEGESQEESRAPSRLKCTLAGKVMCSAAVWAKFSAVKTTPKTTPLTRLPRCPKTGRVLRPPETGPVLCPETGGGLTSAEG